MEQMLELMAAPFAACVILVGIHAYLGMHVIQRKIIFVDLALAQIAALGATFGFLLGFGPHGRGAYFLSLGFAIVGAAIFAVTRMRQGRIPQEAIIGIVYAVAMAGAILVADRAPEGAEHIKETLVGTLLWVRWPTIVKTALIYALVGLLHFVLRRRFLQISFDLEQAYAERRFVRLWDFIFYVTFAFVITSSVAIAGVLVVFSFLVIPAVIGTLFAPTIGGRLALSWAVGIAASLVGMVASYRFDLPSGPSVVSSLGLSLLVAGLIYSVLSAPKKRYAFLKVLAGTLVVAGVVVLLSVFFTSGTFLHIAHEHEWEEQTADLSDSGPQDHLREDLTAACGDDAACLRERLLAADDWIGAAEAGIHETDGGKRSWWIALLAGVSDPRASDLLFHAAADEPDPLARLEIVSQLIARNDPRGAELAAGLLTDAMPPLIRDAAWSVLTEISGREFGYDPFASETENGAAIARIRDWLSRRDTG